MLIDYQLSTYKKKTFRLFNFKIGFLLPKTSFLMDSYCPELIFGGFLLSKTFLMKSKVSDSYCQLHSILLLMIELLFGSNFDKRLLLSRLTTSDSPRRGQSRKKVASTTLNPNEFVRVLKQFFFNISTDSYCPSKLFKIHFFK